VPGPRRGGGDDDRNLDRPLVHEPVNASPLEEQLIVPDVHRGRVAAYRGPPGPGLQERLAHAAGPFSVDSRPGRPRGNRVTAGGSGCQARSDQFPASHSPGPGGAPPPGQGPRMSVAPGPGQGAAEPRPRAKRLQAGAGCSGSHGKFCSARHSQVGRSQRRPGGSCHGFAPWYRSETIVGNKNAGPAVCASSLRMVKFMEEGAFSRSGVPGGQALRQKRRPARVLKSPRGAGRRF